MAVQRRRDLGFSLLQELLDGLNLSNCLLQVSRLLALLQLQESGHQLSIVQQQPPGPLMGRSLGAVGRRRQFRAALPQELEQLRNLFAGDLLPPCGVVLIAAGLWRIIYVKVQY